MAAFKVIIVGGSIAGLTLANILERYGIDYIVLEKHDSIAPQLGASLGLFPHGSRILDQMGIYEKLKTHSMPVQYSQDFGPDGLALRVPEPWGDLMEELLGYRMWFMDRQHILKGLYDSLLDKSKIHTSNEFFKIEELDEGVRVALKDGSTIYGDILVGADGVHSRTRTEMWCIADMEGTDYDAAQLKKSITCTYRCMFGISTRPEGIPDEISYKTFFEGRSYLCPTGPDNKMYFFVFFKNSETTIHQDIPRYTEEEAKELAAVYANDTLFNGVTFGDLYERRMSSVLVPLEEFVLEKCFYKRTILIGDAFHKMNPLAGQGGNSAIESAGFISDLLKKALDENPHLDNDSIQRIFYQFQEERRPRTTKLMESTKKMQRMESLDNRFLRFLQLNVLTKLGGLQLAPMLAEASTPGRMLKYLPRSTRGGAVLPDEEVKVNPRDRSSVATVSWILLMLFTALLGSLLPRSLDIVKDSNSEFGILQIYKFFTTVAISGFWMVESYRPGLLISPLFSSIPYIVACFSFAWEIVLPIYLAMHIYMSGQKPFYYPFPRAINAAKALPFTLVTAYTPIILWSATVLGRSPGETTTVHARLAIQLVHVSLPLLFHLGKCFYQSGAPQLSPVQILFGARDLKYVSRFFGIMFLVSSTAHLVLLSMVLPELSSGSRSLMIAPSVELVQIGCLGLVITVWCTFTVWDMHRVNLTEATLPVTLFSALVGTVILGPAAVLAGLWRWREYVLEKGRQRK